MTERSPAEILGEIAAARTEAWSDFWRRVYVTTPTGREPSEPEMQEIASRGVPILIVGYETDGYDFGIADKMIPITDAMRDAALAGERGPDIIRLDDRMLDDILDMPVKIAAEDIRPAKSYLAHDPTKNTRKVRRCKGR